MASRPDATPEEIAKLKKQAGRAYYDGGGYPQPPKDLADRIYEVEPSETPILHDDGKTVTFSNRQSELAAIQDYVDTHNISLSGKKPKPGALATLPYGITNDENIWIANLAQYYLGMIEQRPTPRRLTEKRAKELKREVYLSLPQAIITSRLQLRRDAKA